MTIVILENYISQLISRLTGFYTKIPPSYPEKHNRDIQYRDDENPTTTAFFSLLDHAHIACFVHSIKALL